jgi:excisionase family DNA binding protein
MTDQITPAVVPARHSVERVTLTRREAAAALGVSVDHFERHIQPGLPLIRSGRKVLVPVAELHRWADREAARTLDGASS